MEERRKQTEVSRRNAMMRWNGSEANAVQRDEDLMGDMVSSLYGRQEGRKVRLRGRDDQWTSLWLFG